MSSARHKTLALRLIAALNDHNLAVIDDCVTPDFVELGATPGMRPGPEGMRNAVREVYRTVANPHWEALGLVAEGTTVVLRVHFTGTASTGSAISVEQVHFYEVRDDRLATHHAIEGKANPRGQHRHPRRVGHGEFCVPVREFCDEIARTPAGPPGVGDGRQRAQRGFRANGDSLVTNNGNPHVKRKLPLGCL